MSEDISRLVANAPHEDPISAAVEYNPNPLSTIVAHSLNFSNSVEDRILTLFLRR